jgi:hypothetical protein
MAGKLLDVGEMQGRKMPMSGKFGFFLRIPKARADISTVCWLLVIAAYCEGMPSFKLGIDVAENHTTAYI